MPERKESLIRCEQWLFNIFGETILGKWHLACEFYWRGASCCCGRRSRKQ